MKLRSFSMILVGLSLFGCAGAKQIPPQEYKFEKIVVIDKPFKDVWNSAVEWYAVSNIPFTDMDKEDGLISSSYGLRMGSDIDCGEASGQITWASATMENVNGNVNTVIRANEENTTKVIINVFGGGEINIRNGYGNIISHSKARCVSTGKLESSLIAYLRNQ